MSGDYLERVSGVSLREFRRNALIEVEKLKAEERRERCARPKGMYRFGIFCAMN